MPALASDEQIRDLCDKMCRYDPGKRCVHFKAAADEISGYEDWSRKLPDCVTKNMRMKREPTFSSLLWGIRILREHLPQMTNPELMDIFPGDDIDEIKGHLYPYFESVFPHFRADVAIVEERAKVLREQIHFPQHAEQAARDAIAAPTLSGSLEKMVRTFMQHNADRSVETIEIAKACKGPNGSNRQVNATLYALEKTGAISKVCEQPPAWRWLEQSAGEFSQIPVQRPAPSKAHSPPTSSSCGIPTPSQEGDGKMGKNGAKDASKGESRGKGKPRDTGKAGGKKGKSSNDLNFGSGLKGDVAKFLHEKRPAVLDTLLIAKHCCGEGATKQSVNPTLFALQKDGLIEKCADAPPAWCWKN